VGQQPALGHKEPALSALERHFRLAQNTAAAAICKLNDRGSRNVQWGQHPNRNTRQPVRQT